MSELSHRYRYEARNIVVPQKEVLDVAAAVRGIKRSVFFSGHVTSEDVRIVYDLVVINDPKQYRMKHVVLTAIESKLQRAVGFRDLRINDMGMSFDSGCFGSRGERIPKDKCNYWDIDRSGVPYSQLRFDRTNHDGRYGFLVSEQVAREGADRGMLFTAFEIAKRLGARKHWVNHDTNDSLGSSWQAYYRQLGMQGDSETQLFDLS